jgi:hypothetical protein
MALVICDETMIGSFSARSNVSAEERMRGAAIIGKLHRAVHTGKSAAKPNGCGDRCWNEFLILGVNL